MRAAMSVRIAAALVAIVAVAGVLAYASGLLPPRRVPEEIRFYLDKGMKVSPEEIERASALVVATKRSLERYRDPAKAIEDGYFNSTPGAGGVNHWVNLQFMKDGRILDLHRPENLMYYRTSSGRDVLVGAMFLMQAPGEQGPPIWGEMTRWHLHPAYCWAPVGFPVSPSEPQGEPCPPGQALMDTPEMLHVWIVPSEHGVFAEEMDLQVPPE